MTDENKTLERLKAELAELRGDLDHLRVQANLGKMEAREKLHELEERLEPAFRRAKRRLEGIVADGTAEARTLGKSLLSGWEEVRRTHRELSRESRQERG